MTIQSMLDLALWNMTSQSLCDWSGLEHDHLKYVGIVLSLSPFWDMSIQSQCDILTQPSSNMSFQSLCGLAPFWNLSTECEHQKHLWVRG